MSALPDKIYCASIPRHTGKEQAQVAIRAGKTARDIFIEGVGAESFMSCVNAIRGPGTLGLVGGAFVLGQGRAAIMEKFRILRERQITPYNFKTGVSDPAELLSEALGKLNAERTMGRGPRPKVRGKRGGEMKGIRAHEHRESVMSEAIVRRLWKCPKLTGQDVANILGKPFSETTLRRQLGPRTKPI